MMSAIDNEKTPNCATYTEDHARLLDLIDKMTTSGLLKLDENLIKTLKQICRKSDEYVEHVYYLLMTRLEKRHSEMRLSAFQIARELFVRSHCFRDLLLSDFQHFIELVLETNLNCPLPPPKRAASELKQQAAVAINDWHEKFAKTYKKLAVAFNFLKNQKKIDFTNIEARSGAERHRQETLRLKREQKDEQRLVETLNDMKDGASEIEACITESQNCISLLLAEDDIFNFNTESNSAVETSSKRTYSESSAAAAAAAAAYDSSSSSTSDADSDIDSSRQLDTTTATSKPNTTPTPSSRTCEHDDTATSSTELRSRTASEDHDRDEQPCVTMSDTSELAESSDTAAGGDLADRWSSDTAARREHGVQSFRYALHIDIASHVNVQETDDNSAIIRDLQDQAALLVNRFLPAIKRWLDTLSKVGASQEHIKRALDMRSAVEATIRRIEKLNIVSIKPRPAAAGNAPVDSDSDDDVDDLVEVPVKEGLELRIPDHRREEYGLPVASTSHHSSVPWEWKERKLDVEDPATLVANVLKRQQLERQQKARSPRIDSRVSSSSSRSSDVACQPSTSSTEPVNNEQRQNLLDKAPVVPYGTDLHFWGDSFEIPLIVRNDTDSHRWWSTRDPDDAVDQNALQASKSRLINFVGEFERVKWKCRAPLPNGSLCERMDRVKCPFHGKIIARDEEGKIAINKTLRRGHSKMDSASTDRMSTDRMSTDGPSTSHPGATTNSSAGDWDDPELQADILLATGVDLRRKEKGRGKNRQKKECGLTNIRALKRDTARKRLESKIFNSSAVKRVADALDTLDEKRFKDKFANNFTSTFTH